MTDRQAFCRRTNTHALLHACMHARTHTLTHALTLTHYLSFTDTQTRALTHARTRTDTHHASTHTIKHICVRARVLTLSQLLARSLTPPLTGQQSLAAHSHDANQARQCSFLLFGMDFIGNPRSKTNREGGDRIVLRSKHSNLSLRHTCRILSIKIEVVEMGVIVILKIFPLGGVHPPVFRPRQPQ